MCCSVLRCVAVCLSASVTIVLCVLQCVAVCCGVFVCKCDYRVSTRVTACDVHV